MENKEDLTAEELLDRADLLLRKAIVMTDDWTEAMQWCNDFIDFKVKEPS